MYFVKRDFFILSECNRDEVTQIPSLQLWPVAVIIIIVAHGYNNNYYLSAFSISHVSDYVTSKRFQPPTNIKNG